MRSKKQAIRQAMRQIRGADGRTLFRSVKYPDEHGIEVELYKQRTFFDFHDYEQSVTFDAKYIQSRLEKMIRDAEECEVKTGKRPALPLTLERMIYDLV